MGGILGPFGTIWENDPFNVFDGHFGYYLTMDFC